MSLIQKTGLAQDSVAIFFAQLFHLSSHIPRFLESKRHIRDRFTKVVNSYKPWLLREPPMLWVLVMLHLIQLCLNPGKV
ncbi:hypothetical protein L1887_28331 [Cichorium endivia]|nr:hypothetical protein L1887_28331 [Cichorium endivia]